MAFGDPGWEGAVACACTGLNFFAQASVALPQVLPPLPPPLCVCERDREAEAERQERQRETETERKTGERDRDKRERERERERELLTHWKTEMFSVIRTAYIAHSDNSLPYFSTW